ncbi:MAG: SWIM zinc finger family protein [Nitriliruptorales bacterium]
MARRGSGSGWYPPPTPPRPVEGGLRARSRRGDIGESWWSRRFLGLLESFGIGGRLDRGKTYARKGQVISLDVEPGAVTALVQGSRARPYRVRIGLARLSEADWRRAEDAMVSRAAFVARLLAGEMPEDIAEAFADCSLDLFPTALSDLAVACSCPDWASPCKHVAAVYYLLAEAFDDDPFLILRWRGRPREELLRNLRALRGTDPASPVAERDHDPWAQIEAVPAPTRGDPGGFWQTGAAFAELRLDPSPPRVPDAAIRALAELDRTVAGTPVAEPLAAAYPRITAGARARLLGDTADG